ncbi:MAG: GNAT family N-acetyltransferase [Acetobacteraceae bacterium]
MALRAGGPAAGEPTVSVTVDVTFLRMEAPPATPAPPFPPGVSVVRASRCSVAFYRYLYDTVGGPWLWWLRRTTPDSDLARHLAHPSVAIRVLYRDGEPAGFYELEGRPDRSVNLAYFGLMPWMIGRGLGRAFLRDAVDVAWHAGAEAVTVNTCTADHPRALPNYLACGFTPLRTLRETWPIPVRLGLTPPEHLRARG